jgi:L-malate glycosyltransferase
MRQRRRLRIFISDPSPFLTNHRPYGDGLMAWEFMSRLAARGHTVHVAAPLADISGRLPANLMIKEYRPTARFDILRTFRMMLKIKSIFVSVGGADKIDLIHQLNPVCDGLSVFVRNAGVPLVLGLFVPAWPETSAMNTRRISVGKRLLRAWALQLIDRADLAQEKSARLLVLSTVAAKSAVHRFTGVDEKIRILPYGIDIGQFTPHLSDAKTKGFPTILFLANLLRHKGIFTLLDAFDLVAQRIPDCRLEIGGSGSRRTVRGSGA